MPPKKKKKKKVKVSKKGKTKPTWGGPIGGGI